MCACIARGEALLVGGLGRCLDVVGAIGASLDNGLTAIEAAVVLAGEVAFEPLDRYDIFDLHEITFFISHVWLIRSY